MLLIGELYDKDTVLCHQTNQHDDTDLAEYIHCDVSEIHEYQCAGNGKGHRQHDNQRVFEAFELGGQNQVDKQDCQNESEHQTGRAFTVLF